MTAKEAYGLLMKKYPKFYITKCYDYKTRFVFIIEIEGDKNNNEKKYIGNMMCVVKDTGEIRDFKPFHIPVEEYRAGKKVANFKD